MRDHGVWILLAATFSTGALAAPAAVTCATCHPAIAKTYAQTGMGRAFAAASPANVAQGEYFHTVSQTHYRILERGGEFFQRRWQKGPAGEEINVEELRIDWVMGSGNHARSYLHRTARGTLIELPLGWYADTGVGVSPGFDVERPRTRRFISYRCMSCHNAAPSIPAGNEAPGSDPVFTGSLPQGIDCQHCHGPGESHMAKPARTNIVNPKRFPNERRLEVCMQCHLETTSSPIPSAIVKFDRGPFSFQPGEKLENYLLAFDHAKGTGHDGKFEVVGSVYRLRQSRCFLESKGRMLCESCHNPHRAPRGAEAVTQYDAACRQCHATVEHRTAKTAAKTNCAGCHMPKRRAEDTAGLVITDHLIQRGPVAGNLTAKFRDRPPEQYLGEVVPYYPVPMNDPLYVAVAQVGMKNNLDGGLPRLIEQIAQRKPSNPEFYMVLGEGLLSRNRTREAIAAFERATQLGPKSVRAWRGLAAADTAKAREHLLKALSIAPDDAITWHKLGMVERSPERIRQAIRLDPSLPDQQRSLAEVLFENGKRVEAQAAVADALRTDPYDDAAWALQARLQDMPAAKFSFEEAIRLSPKEPMYAYNYGLALARAGQMEDALKFASRANTLNPALANVHELLGGIHESQRRIADAVREYRRALELDPGLERLKGRLQRLQQ